MSDGFFKLSEGSLLYARNNVYNKHYELDRNNRNNFQPTDGWYWFDSLEEAISFFNIEPERYEFVNGILIEKS